MDPAAKKGLMLALNNRGLQPVVDYICERLDELVSAPDYYQIAVATLH
jgi:hypothetical protein